MSRLELQFSKSATALSECPRWKRREIAIAGRSNVGKSSLINAVTGRHGLARASTAPGRTREVNFFVADETLRLVDLPGYGFAKVGRGEKNKFQNLGRSYLRGRPNLKRCFLLIDSRHGLKDVDNEAMEAFDLAAVSYQIVLTKTDKLRSQRDIDQVTAETLRKVAKRPAAFPRVLATSAEKGAGIPQLRAEILAACAA